MGGRVRNYLLSPPRRAVQISSELKKCKSWAKAAERLFTQEPTPLLIHKSAFLQHRKTHTVYTPLSGVPRFPISRSANSDFPLKRHDLHGKEQLRRRFSRSAYSDFPHQGTLLRGVCTVLRFIWHTAGNWLPKNCRCQDVSF